MPRPMTITEKILAAHADTEAVRPGDLIKVRVDLALGNDITAPLAIKTFWETGVTRVFDPEKVVLVADHFVPNKDIASAQQTKLMYDFAVQQKLKHYYDPGNGGVEHVILPEKGLVIPGDLVIGGDSHTCTYGALAAFSSGVGSTDLGVVMATGRTWLKVPPTIKVVIQGPLQKWVGGKDLILYLLGKLGVDGAAYKALEFTGETIENLTMEQRLTMANMAVEGGAKNGIFAPDKITRAYVLQRTNRKPVWTSSDSDAVYERVLTLNADGIEPQVAFPHSPDNVRPISAVGDIPLNQVFIGSCTNGRLEDLRQAALILRNKKIAKQTRLIVLPGSALVYKQALQEGILETFLDAGAVIGPPTCGPCLGGHMGILAENERALATSNCNFMGRMGHPKSEVYLCGPALAAASAVLGRIGAPEEV